MNPRILSAVELLATDFPDPRWAVPGLIPEGATVLAARPKIGKSWLMLATGVAIATGGRALGQIPCQSGDVLYLALEDTPRRLQSRLALLLQGQPVPERLYLVTEWKRLDLGGLEDLEAWLAAHPDARFIVVDTLAKVRPRRRRDGNLYDEDYEAMASLKALADRYGVGIVANHHLRKSKAEDPFDAISGTLGLTAAADTNLVIERNRGAAEAVLHVTGRDVDEATHALHWDGAVGGWTILDVPLPDASAERIEVYQAVELLQPCGPSQVARHLGRPLGTMKRLMTAMAEDGQLRGGGSAYRTPEPGEPFRPAVHDAEQEAGVRPTVRPRIPPEPSVAADGHTTLFDGSASSDGSPGSPGSPRSGGSEEEGPSWQ